jgi:hypothetical protein
MNLRWLILLAVCGLAAHGEDWQTTLTPIAPGSFPALRPLQATYRFGWGKFSAATATFDYSKPKADLLKLDVTARSEGFVRSLWRMDATQTALCHADTLRPLSAEQTETYKREELKTQLDFDAVGVARLRVSKPPDKNPPKTKRFDFPAVFDLYSALLFVRSQPLQPGDVVRLVVYPATAPYLAEISVLAREKVEVNKQSRDALKLSVKLQRISKKLQLESHKKFKRATAWLSDDNDRLLLKIAAEIAVGHVWAEMDSVKFGGEQAGSVDPNPAQSPR